MGDINVGASKKISMEDIAEMAGHASAAMAVVKGAMLAPNAIKQPPTFSSAQLMGLLDMTAAQFEYRNRTTDLPGGTNASGTRRAYSLNDVRTWCRRFRTGRYRPPGAEAVVISVVNYKGGVSKTTTAFTLAQGLATRGHNVLFVDLDPQGSATSLFSFEPSEIKAEESLLPLCMGKVSGVEPVIRQTYWSGIDLAPASNVLYGAEFALPARQRTESDFAFWNVLHYGIDVARQNYDVIIFDTSPSLSYLTVNAMIAADGVIMPLPPAALDLISACSFWALFVEIVSSFEARGLEKNFDFVDILLAKVDSADVASNLVRQWASEAFGSRVLPVEIPKTSTAASASAEFGSIYDMRPGVASSRTMKRAIDAYDRFVQTIESQIVTAWANQMASRPTPAMEAA